MNWTLPGKASPLECLFFLFSFHILSQLHTSIFERLGRRDWLFESTKAAERSTKNEQTGLSFSGQDGVIRPGSTPHTKLLFRRMLNRSLSDGDDGGLLCI